MSGPSPKRPPSLLLLCMAQFVLVLDFAIVNVALPSIQTDLGFTDGQLPWVVGAYALFFGGFLLVGGHAGDLFGRKRMLVAGMAVFTLSSLVGGLASDPTMLIAARACQGLAAALVSPAVLALIASGYREGLAYNSAIGWYGAVSSAGFAGGVLSGGVLTELFGWRAVMFVNVPIGIVLIAGSAKLLVADRAARSKRGVDVLGAALITASTCSAIYGFTVASDQGWGESSVAWSLGGAIVAFVAFVAREATASDPLITLGILRNRSLVAGNAIAFLSGGVMAISTFFITVYMQVVLDYSPLVAGLAFFPQAAVVVVASLPVVKLTDRFGPMLVLAGGGVFLVAGSAGLVLAPDVNSFWVNILPWGVLLALGITVMMITTAVAATSGVSGPRIGLASGLYNSSRQLGVALWLAAAVAISGLGRQDATLDALHSGLIVSVVVSAAIVVFALAVPDTPRAGARKSQQEARASSAPGAAPMNAATAAK